MLVLRSEEDVRASLCGVLHLQPPLLVLLGPVVVVASVLPPGQHRAHRQVQQQRTQQHPTQPNLVLPDRKCVVIYAAN